MPISEYENNLTAAKWKGMFVPALRKVSQEVVGRNRPAFLFRGKMVKFRSIVFPNLRVDLILKVSTERGVFTLAKFWQRICIELYVIANCIYDLS